MNPYRYIGAEEPIVPPPTDSFYAPLEPATPQPAQWGTFGLGVLCGTLVAVLVARSQTPKKKRMR